MSNATARTVSVTCKCGNQFDREVKRGRPQIWCPTCLAIPFYERATGSVTPEVTSLLVLADAVTATVEAKAVPVRNENDRHWAVRDELEAAVAEVNDGHKLRVAEAVVAGLSIREAADEAAPLLHDALIAVYARFK